MGIYRLKTDNILTCHFFRGGEGGKASILRLKEAQSRYFELFWPLKKISSKLKET